MAALHLCLAGFVPAAQADGLGMHLLAHAEVPEIEIHSTHDTFGNDSASEGRISAARLDQQGLLRPADAALRGAVITECVVRAVNFNLRHLGVSQQMHAEPIGLCGWHEACKA